MTQGGVLESTLTELQKQSEETFISSLEQLANQMLVKVETPPRDLSPTPAILHLLAILRDMLSTASMNEGREQDMVKVNKIQLHSQVLRNTIKIEHSRLVSDWRN